MRLRAVGLLGLMTSVGLGLHTPQIADACGLKMTVKPSSPRKAVPRTSNPSPVLLVGTPPKRLERDLALAGHKVEVAPEPAAAKRESYAVVVVDSDAQAQAARGRWSNAVVIVRTGDVRADLDSVENRVARRPDSAKTNATAVAAREIRKPVAAGPDAPGTRAPTAAKPVETPVVAAVEPPPAATPPPAAVTTTTTPPAPARPTPAPTPPREERIAAAPPRTEDKVTPVEKPVPVAKTAAELHEELFFGVGKSGVGNAYALAKAIKWLNANASVNVVVTGHADPSGTADGNMALSQARAEAVRDYLVGKGIDASRVEVKALGDTQLKYGAKDGRNRRVAIDATK